MQKLGGCNSKAAKHCLDWLLFFFFFFFLSFFLVIQASA